MCVGVFVYRFAVVVRIVAFDAAGLSNGKDVAEKMVEKRCVVHEMHSCADEYQQYGGDYCLFAGHRVRRLFDFKFICEQMPFADVGVPTNFHVFSLKSNRVHSFVFCRIIHIEPIFSWA